MNPQPTFLSSSAPGTFKDGKGGLTANAKFSAAVPPAPPLVEVLDGADEGVVPAAAAAVVAAAVGARPNLPWRVPPHEYNSPELVKATECDSPHATLTKSRPCNSGTRILRSFVMFLRGNNWHSQMCGRHAVYEFKGEGMGRKSECVGQLPYHETLSLSLSNCQRAEQRKGRHARCDLGIALLAGHPRSR